MYIDLTFEKALHHACTYTCKVLHVPDTLNSIYIRHSWSSLKIEKYYTRLFAQGDDEIGQL
jgi:hypothetical protein